MCVCVFDRYLRQSERGLETRLLAVVTRLALAAPPDAAKMIADAAAASSASSASSNSTPSGRSSAGGGGGGAGEEDGTARDRARAARSQPHAERALSEFVKDLVGSFLADSFGIPTFARVLRMFVRTGFPAAARYGKM